MDRPDDKGRTALYVAAQYNAQQAATTLLEQVRELAMPLIDSVV